MADTTQEHDKDCGGCATEEERREQGGLVLVNADLAICARCGPTRRSSSYLHDLGGKRYCRKCVDIVARTKSEAAIGIGW